MEWHLSNDNTRSIITAKAHINSEHGNNSMNKLPETCVIFEIGMAMKYIEENFETTTLTEKLPCFLDNPKCIMIKGYDNICFTRGGYGAPAAVDTLETVIALGVKRVIIAGMCGVFEIDINVGDVIIPYRILSEEGTSHHYFSKHFFSYPNECLFEQAQNYFGIFLK